MARIFGLLLPTLFVASLPFGATAVALEQPAPIAPDGASGDASGLPGTLSGAEAFVSLLLQAELVDVADGVGWSASELATTLLSDASAFVTGNGAVGYADPAPDAAEGTPVAAPPAHANSSDVFTLHSQPGAPLKVFLDFDGHVTTATGFNTRDDQDSANDIATIVSAPFDRDGNPGSLTTAETDEIAAVWRIVAEDFAPFAVDVTTQDPGALALTYSGIGDTGYGTRIVISPSDGWVDGNFGGLAYVGSFKRNTPAFVFSSNLANYKAVGDAAAHEAGHTFGLAHDGTSVDMYYSGLDAWGPIMGNSYSRELAQWSRGEYDDANNSSEDDLATIAALLSYRPDDHGDTTATATQLTGSGVTSGFVGADDLVDMFAVDVVGGGIDARVTPVSAVTNLFASVTIRNDAGTVVATNTPATVASGPPVYGTRSIDWIARATAVVPDGRYTIEVRPAGLGTQAIGFSTYGSHGEFRLAVGVGATVSAVTGNQVRFTPIQPVRLADTRSGHGGSTRLDAGDVLNLRVAGMEGVPADVTAAALNVTAVGPDTGGFLTVYPCSATVPTTSTVNFAAGRDIANSTIATLSPDGDVCVYSSAAANVIVDMTGWFSRGAATAMSATAPHRVADTRSGVMGSGRLAPGMVLTVQTGDHQASAVALNVTAVGADGAGFLTVFPCGTLPPVASTVNFAAGEARPNNTIVAVAPGGLACVYSSAAVDVIVDVTAVFSPGGALEYVPAAPQRLIDTRETGVVGAGAQVAFAVTSPGTTAPAVSVNVTATGQTADGFSTVFGCGTSVPEASTLNQRVGEANANGAIVPVGAGPAGCVFTSSATNLIVDLNGWWLPAA